MPRLQHCLAWTPVLLTVALARPTFAAEPAKLDFNRDVRPILADRCFLCHGPDAGHRKAELRLDQRDVAVAKKAIVPGKPAESGVVQRIFATDSDEVMPPPASHLKLTPAEKETLKRWIAEGAEYKRHWSFEPIPASDAKRDLGETIATLDGAVETRLQKERLALSPPTSKEVWLRRATFDLTGLPPTPEEIDRFLVDLKPDAFDRAADRLLASPRFGEKLAVDWLDAARYADSFGYQADGDMHVWPYRDWVVRAFNDNLPYDKFLAWQIAGDLMENPKQDQRIATAFCRLHRMTNEGGSIAEEWRNESVSDRVHTFGSAMLGLTMECTRCHDHKYDPLTMQDYYALGAFFNSIDEWGTYDNSYFRPTPTMTLPTKEQERKLEELEQRVAQLEKQLSVEEDEVRTSERMKDKQFRGHWYTKGRIASYEFEHPPPATRSKGGGLEEADWSTSPANKFVNGKRGKALLFTGDDPANFPDIFGVIERWQRFTVAFWLKTPPEFKDGIVFHRSSGTDTGFNGLVAELVDRRFQVAFIRFWPGNAAGVRTVEKLPANKWVHIAITYDGSSRAGGFRLYLDGKRAAQTTVADNLTKNIEANRGHGAGQTGLTFGERFRSQGLKGAALDELVVFDRVTSPFQFYQGPRSTNSHDDSDRDFDVHYFSSPDRDRILASLTDARKAYFAAQTEVFELMVMQESETPRPAYILARGEYDAPKNRPVGRDTPATLPAFPAEAPRNRLGLAEWLVDPNHPLTARVAVNRIWQMCFGRGLVPSSENFGTQGAAPTHPELLDFLARDFVDSGWDLKRLCKAIVLSRTYRQQSHASASLLEKDPENDLLARGPKRRLSAESIRDAALFVGGMLVDKLGGPPAKPYQPPNLWHGTNSFLPEYVADKGEGLYRRSMYTFWRRTAPPPNMLAFDAAGREVCSVKRLPTLTPLQPLVLLNDPQFVEAARGLGERMLTDGGKDSDKIVASGFRRAVGRAPGYRETRLLAELFEKQREAFRKNPKAATDYLSVGSRPIPKQSLPADLAAAAVTASAILNHDGFVMLR